MAPFSKEFDNNIFVFANVIEEVIICQFNSIGMFPPFRQRVYLGDKIKKGE